MKAVLLEPLRLDLPPLAGLSRSGCAPVPPCHVQGPMVWEQLPRFLPLHLTSSMCVCLWRWRARC